MRSEKKAGVPKLLWCRHWWTSVETLQCSLSSCSWLKGWFGCSPGIFSWKASLLPDGHHSIGFKKAFCCLYRHLLLEKAGHYWHFPGRGAVSIPRTTTRLVQGNRGVSPVPMSGLGHVVSATPWAAQPPGAWPRQRCSQHWPYQVGHLQLATGKAVPWLWGKDGPRRAGSNQFCCFWGLHTDIEHMLAFAALVARGAAWGLGASIPTPALSRWQQS